MWAVVLVPMWARRYSPSDTELSPQARVITRRSSVNHNGAEHARREPREPGVLGLRRPASSATMRRRRLVLAGLIAAVLVMSVGTLAGLLPPLVLLLPVVPLAGYVGWLRRTARQIGTRRRQAARELASTRAMRFRDFGQPQPARSADTMAAETAAAETMATEAISTETMAVETMAVETAASSRAADPANLPSVATPSSEPWLPVSIPLPSYVTASPAPTVVNGDWHEEDLMEGELPGEASAYALDADLMRRRAVGD